MSETMKRRGFDMTKIYALTSALFLFSTPILAQDLCEPLSPKGGDEILRVLKAILREKLKE